MDDGEKLRFLEKLLGKYKYSQSTREAEFYCIFCSHHKPKLSVNLETGYFQCWVCGKSGKNLSFLIRSAGGTKSDLDEFFDKFQIKPSNFKDFEEENNAFRPELPREFTPIVACLGSIMGKKAYRYLTSIRKISPQQILQYKIGLTFADEWQNSIIFPSFDKKGNLNYFTARFYDGRKRSVTAPRGYKNQIIINELNINWEKPVVITEGPIDWLKSVENTIPLFGSTIVPNSKLFDAIVSNNASVILGLDSDANKKRNYMAKNFMKRGVLVYTMDLGSYNDLGEMSKEEARLRYENAKIFTAEDILRSKLRAIC